MKKGKVPTATITKAEADFLPEALKRETDKKATSRSAVTGPENTTDIKEKWSFLSYKNKGPSSKVSDSSSSASLRQGGKADSGIDEPPMFTLQPGSFDVILCVDKREHFGG